MEDSFITAVKAGDRARVEEMLSEGSSLADSVDENGVSAVLIAVYYGHRDIAKILASKVPVLSMHEAAALGDLQTIRALGRWPDTLISYSPDGWTPLHLAAAFGGADAVRALLELGAEVDKRSRNAMDNTALHACAAISRSLEVAGFLLDSNADINATQAGGFTALHAAAFNGTEPLVSFLLEHGAETALRTIDGQTAAELAREKNHIELAALLSGTAGPASQSPP